MSNKWYEQKERASGIWLKITLFMVYRTPFVLLKPLIFSVTFFYYVFSPGQRRNIKSYYDKLNRHFNLKKNYKVYSNFYSFGQSIVDKIGVWLGKIKYEDLVLENEKEIIRSLINSKGKVIITSHFGNIEIAKALSNEIYDVKMAILTYSKNTSEFASFINDISKKKVRIFEVDELDIVSMLEFEKFIQTGGHICVMADRTPLKGNKVCEVRFLGKKTFFPQGGFIIASLLKCQVVSLWCVRQKDAKYHLKLNKIAQNVDRKNICKYVQKYVEMLEQECLISPSSWFNFYDYWDEFDDKKKL